MSPKDPLLALVLLLSITTGVSAWVSPLIQRRNLQWQRTVPVVSLTLPDEQSSQADEELIKVTPQASYGMSFMGGDPCGSKYNDDPFDATKEKKPGIPDDVKARIAALAEQKKREMEENKKREEAI